MTCAHMDMLRLSLPADIDTSFACEAYVQKRLQETGGRRRHERIVRDTKEQKLLLPDSQPEYLATMKETMPSVPAESLKPRLHCKIERMSSDQLALLDRVMLQIEAEDLAGHLGEAFDEDQRQGKLQRLSELVRQFRTGHPYA